MGSMRFGQPDGCGRVVMRRNKHFRLVHIAHDDIAVRADCLVFLHPRRIAHFLRLLQHILAEVRLLYLAFAHRKPRIDLLHPAIRIHFFCSFSGVRHDLHHRQRVSLDDKANIHLAIRHAVHALSVMLIRRARVLREQAHHGGQILLGNVLFELLREIHRQAMAFGLLGEPADGIRARCPHTAGTA